MIPSLSLRGLGYDQDCPLTVTRIAVATGFRGVHLHLHHPTDPGDLDRLTGLIEDHQLAVTWVHPLEEILAPDPAVRRDALDRFTRTAMSVARCGARTLSCWLPAAIPASGPGLAGVLEPFVDRAGAAGLVVALEYVAPEPPGPPAASTLTSMIEMLVALGPAVGFTADTVHLDAAGALPAPGNPAARGWLTRTRDVHLADPAVGPQPGAPRLPPGITGQIDHVAVLATLMAAGYTGPVMVEAPTGSDAFATHAARQAHALLTDLIAIAAGTAAPDLSAPDPEPAVTLVRREASP